MGKRVVGKPVEVDGLVVRLLPIDKLEKDWSWIAHLCGLFQTSFRVIEGTWDAMYRYGTADLEAYMAKPPSKNAIEKTKRVMREYYSE